MRVPYSWLREYCDPGVTPAELADRLVMTGTEVERIDVVGPPSPDNFVIGKVTEAVQHPDADRLRVCTVDVGEDGPRTIVCGAPNVGSGQTVAVALPGARMPGGSSSRTSAAGWSRCWDIRRRTGSNRRHSSRNGFTRKIVRRCSHSAGRPLKTHAR